MPSSQLHRQAIIDAVSRAAKGTAISRVYLFGSQARNEANEYSDIDLCLETDPGFSLIDVGLFEDSVAQDCGCNVDVISDLFLTPTTRANVQRDKVLVYER